MKRLSRHDANLQILKLLKQLVEAEPNWRFHQILQNCDASFYGNSADQWFEESEETLNRMKLSPLLK